MSGLSDFIYSNKKKEIMLTIQNLTYQHPDKDVLLIISILPFQKMKK